MENRDALLRDADALTRRRAGATAPPTRLPLKGTTSVPRYQCDDNFGDSPEAHLVGTAALGLYFRCGLYCARHLTDGIVPAEVVATYGSKEWLRKLADAGLMVEVPGGWRLPRYLEADHNPTRAKVLADREAKAVRQANWLRKKKSPPAPTRRRVSRPSSGASNDASRDAPADLAHPHPFGIGDGAAASGQRTSARQLGFCAIHQIDISAGGVCRGCRADQIAETQ